MGDSEGGDGSGWDGRRDGKVEGGEGLAVDERRESASRSVNE